MASDDLDDVPDKEKDQIRPPRRRFTRREAALVIVSAVVSGSMVYLSCLPTRRRLERLTLLYAPTVDLHIQAEDQLSATPGEVNFVLSISNVGTKAGDVVVFLEPRYNQVAFTPHTRLAIDPPQQIVSKIDARRIVIRLTKSLGGGFPLTITLTGIECPASLIGIQTNLLRPFVYADGKVRDVRFYQSIPPPRKPLIPLPTPAQGVRPSLRG